MGQPLSRQERDILAFERHAANLTGKGARETLAARLWPQLTPVRYYQLLNALIQRPEAEAHAPQVVRYLRARARKR